MAYRKYFLDDAKIERLYKEGRGQGRAAEYSPWIKTHDCPSTGRRHRVLGLKTRRIHHLLSDLEWKLFLHLDWCEEILDIREQFPLERDQTRRIAERIGINHPKYPSTSTHIVMTTDFLVDFLVDGRLCQEAYSVKPAKELDKPSIIEKLEIERAYWREQRVPYFIATERELPSVQTQNLIWLRTLDFDGQSEPWAGRNRQRANAILAAFPSAEGSTTLRQFCGRMDNELAARTGTSLAITRHLLATKMITTDLNKPLDDRRRMNDFVARVTMLAEEVA